MLLFKWTWLKSLRFNTILKRGVYALGYKIRLKSLQFDIILKLVHHLFFHFFSWDTYNLTSFSNYRANCRWLRGWEPYDLTPFSNLMLRSFSNGWNPYDLTPFSNWRWLKMRCSDWLRDLRFNIILKPLHTIIPKHAWLKSLWFNTILKLIIEIIIVFARLKSLRFNIILKPQKNMEEFLKNGLPEIKKNIFTNIYWHLLFFDVSFKASWDLRFNNISSNKSLTLIVTYSDTAGCGQ